MGVCPALNSSFCMVVLGIVLVFKMKNFCLFVFDITPPNNGPNENHIKMSFEKKLKSSHFLRNIHKAGRSDWMQCVSLRIPENSPQCRNCQSVKIRRYYPVKILSGKILDPCSIEAHYITIYISTCHEMQACSTK